MSLEQKFSNLQENVLLANHTTFRIGGPAKYFIAVKNRDEFIDVVRAAKESSTPFYLLGGGSNLLVADEGFDGLVIKNQISKIKYQKEEKSLKIICDAGASLTKIVLKTTNQGYSGVEWGLGIPGTIGGAICGNAGRLGQDISQVVESVRILDDNLNKKELSAGECEFEYRESRFKKTGEMILEAELILKKTDRAAIDKILSQTKEVVAHSPKFPSAGCIFKNYKLKENDLLLREHPELAERVRGGKIGVGYLIDQSGLKGRQIGGAKIWEGHANYIINVGGAKAVDVSALIELCKKEVKAKYGIVLEEEIRYLT